MSETSEFSAPGPGSLSHAEWMAALFANMVMQQTDTTLMFLGKTPHPETNQPVVNLEAAQMFIDQLEMLALKTKNNLSSEEDRLLQQSLMMLRLEFVQAVGTKGGPASQARPETTPPEGSDETRKRFTKKY